jgi:hypothetical protein
MNEVSVIVKIRDFLSIKKASVGFEPTNAYFLLTDGIAQSDAVGKWT